MPTKSKSWWLWNVIVSGLLLVPFSIGGAFPWWVDAFIVMPTLVVVLVCLAWERLISLAATRDLGGPCVHCGGELAAHTAPTEFYPDGFCLCGVPKRSCGCLGYQPTRRWLDNLHKEDRSEAQNLGGVSR